MDNKTKEGYLISSGFVFAGIILMYANGWKLDITSFIGAIVTFLGLAGFKFPKIAEMLLHWAKKQEGTNTKQFQRNTKNSNQINAREGSHVNVNYINSDKDKKLPNIKYKIASILQGKKEFDFTKDWKVWFWIKNSDDKQYKAYISISFWIDDKTEIVPINRDYYAGQKPFNLHPFDESEFPGLDIPNEVKEAALNKKKIEIRINCEIKDENNKLINKRLPRGYVYHYETNSWYLEP